MRRRWPLWVLLTVAGMLGLLAFCLPSTPTEIPWVALVPSTPIGNEPVASAAEPATGHLDEDAPPPRVEMQLGSDGGPRVACVEVLVEQAMASGTAPLPFVDVALRSGDTIRVARTDARGEAEFELKGGDGKTARVRCPLGAEATVTMSAMAPTRVVLTIRPMAIVRGKVVDAAGSAIANASIMLLPWVGLDTSPEPRCIGASTSNGTYEVALGAGGLLGAQHRIYGPSAMHLVQLPGTPTSPPPVLTIPLVLLSTPAQVSGFVRDGEGRVIADAELEFRSAGRAPPGAELAAVPQRTRSDSRGQYLVTRLLPGRIVFGVRARGHGPAEGALQLDPGRAVRQDIVLPPSCEVAGTVRYADGSPALATVTAGKRGAFTSQVASTAVDGSYRLVDLAPGPIELTAMAPSPSGKRPLEAKTSLEVVAAATNEWHAVLAATDDAANLRGVVVDGNSSPLAGWRVVARPAGGGQVSATTATEGDFAMQTPPGQHVDLRVYGPGKPLTWFADAVQRDVDPAAGRIQVIVRPTAGGRVVARLETSEQAPVPATVRCWHHERGEEVRSQCRPDGTLLWDDVPPGTIDLLFEHPGQAGAPRREQSIDAGATLDLGVIVLGAGGNLFGTVEGPYGLPPPDCELAVVTGEAQGSQRFHAEYAAGRYRFPTLPAGTHTLLVQGPRLAAAYFPITIAANEEKEQPIKLLAGVPRNIRVVIPPDAPGAIALAFRLEHQPMRWLTTAGVQGDTRSQRSVTFVAFLAPGTYEAVAWGARGWSACRSVVFVDGDDSEVILELRPKPPK